MISFLVRRLLQGVAILFIVATITFALVHAAPGEPFAGQLDDPRTPAATREALRRRYGLDQPLGTQYGRYLGRLVRGDLDTSLAQRRPVRAILAEALPRTLLLMGTALAAGFTLGIALGALQAARPGSRLDRVCSRLTVAVAALPDFWLALALLFVFAVRLRWFPVGGMVDETTHAYLARGGRLRDVAWHLVLPATTMALIFAAVVARHQRQALPSQPRRSQPTQANRTTRSCLTPHWPSWRKNACSSTDCFPTQRHHPAITGRTPAPARCGWRLACRPKPS